MLIKNIPEAVTVSTPEWVRLPRQGEAEPRTGLTRSVLNRLCNEKKVKSVSLRDEGKKRGTRLVHLPSLLSYLEGLAA
jgi:hypothetical protein